jgi:hypothetical protein
MNFKALDMENNDETRLQQLESLAENVFMAFQSVGSL